MDSAGNLYGTTKSGGQADEGTVFMMDSSGNETLLYSFGNFPTDGVIPLAGLTRDANGNLYGTTLGGGEVGYGTVFKVDSAGDETILYSFTGATDGRFPYSGVVRDPKGNLMEPPARVAI